eukprot:2449543-Prymnesium_polylepis.2
MGPRPRQGTALASSWRPCTIGPPRTGTRAGATRAAARCSHVAAPLSFIVCARRALSLEVAIATSREPFALLYALKYCALSLLPCLSCGLCAGATDLLDSPLSFSTSLACLVTGNIGTRRTVHYSQLPPLPGRVAGNSIASSKTCGQADLPTEVDCSEKIRKCLTAGA